MRGTVGIWEVWRGRDCSCDPAQILARALTLKPATRKPTSSAKAPTGMMLNGLCGDEGKAEGAKQVRF